MIRIDSPALTISPLDGRGVTQALAADNVGRAEQLRLAAVGLRRNAATHRPRIRPAVYEPELAVNHPGPDQPTYDHGPITADLPDDPIARAAAQLIVRLIVEVLAHQRPVSHLRNLVTPSVARCVRVASPDAGHVRLSSLHMRQPHSEALEAVGVCRTADGHRALAVRIDRRAVREWRCTVFRLL